MFHVNGICRSRTGDGWSCEGVGTAHPCSVLAAASQSLPAPSFTEPHPPLSLSSEESGSEENARTQPKRRAEVGREGRERTGGRRGMGSKREDRKLESEASQGEIEERRGGTEEGKKGGRKRGREGVSGQTLALEPEPPTLSSLG